MALEDKHLTINISTSAVFKVIGVLLALWFVYLIRDILIIIFVAVLLSSALEPSVRFLQKRKVPRLLGISLIYLAGFLILSLVLLLIIPPLTEQIGQLAKNFPFYWEKLAEGFSSIRDYSQEHGFLDNTQKALDSLQTSFSQAAGNIFSLIGAVFGNLISFILILVLTFYFLMEEDAVKKAFRFIAPARYQPYLNDLISRMKERVGQWLRGQLLLGLIIGGMSLVGLWLLGIKYFLVLAVIAGIFELIPYIGPVLGAIPAVFIALTSQSLLKALFVLILYWLIQQVENHLIVPKVMQKAVGLNPIVVIIVILVGAKLAGFVGVILAVPTAAALSEVVKDFFEGEEVKVKDG